MQMMLAASIDQQIIFAIAAAAYGVFVWWNDRRKKKQEEEQQKLLEEKRRLAKESGQVEAPPAAGQAGEPSDQDKLRKFLEALGVPSGEAPPAQPPRPVQPLPPPVIPAPRTPAPPPLPPPLPRPVILAPRPVSPVQPVSRKVVVYPSEPVALESQEAGNLSEVSAEMMRDARAEQKVPTVSMARPTPAAATALKEALRTPENLRAAFLVREILGPPPGLGQGF